MPLSSPKFKPGQKVIYDGKEYFISDMSVFRGHRKEPFNPIIDAIDPSEYYYNIKENEEDPKRKYKVRETLLKKVKI